MQTPITTIAGDNDLSQQILDRTSPNMDTFIAAELGRALGEAIDKAILNGSGSGQTRGLLNVTGATAPSYTDGTPTQTEAFSAIMGLYSDFVAALGEPGTRCCWHHGVRHGSRRSTTPPTWPPSIVSASPWWVPAMPTNLGAGTNEDRVILKSIGATRTSFGWRRYSVSRPRCGRSGDSRSRSPRAS